MAEKPRPVALIVGGTTGIGLATARVLHRQGFAVLVTGTNPETLAAAKRDLPADVLVFSADVRSKSETAGLAEALSDRFGRIDFAFFNAGIGRMLPFEATGEAAFDEHFDITVKGQFFLLQKILPLISEGGSILFTTAVGAHRGAPAWSAYSASRGAISGLVPALAVELAPRGIRVNAVRPGPIDTPALDKLGLPPEAVALFRERAPQRLPLGRLGTPGEVAEVVAFLASPLAGYVTGATFDVDGGMSSAATVINLL